MAGFLKVLFRNLLEGPSTDPLPTKDTPTPERVRGRVLVDPNLCVGCGVCKRVCAAGAIDITRKADKSGFTITVWRNSCCLCAACRHYCPTGAMSINNDWHSAHLESEKFECIEQQVINYDKCAHCGTYIRPLAPKLAKKLYKENPEIEAETIRKLCPKCRQLEDAKRIEGVKTPESLTSSSGSGVELKMDEQAKASAKIPAQADQAANDAQAQSAANESAASTDSAKAEATTSENVEKKSAAAGQAEKNQ